MSGMVRNENHLLTLRAAMEIEREGAQVVFDFWRGRERLLDTIRFDAQALGIPPTLSYRDLSEASFTIPDAVISALHMLQGQRSDAEPFWLQLTRGSSRLALLPWEAVLVQALDAPVFRIPNFVVDPHRLDGPLHLAICASAPAAKTPFPVGGYVRTLVSAIVAAVTQGAVIHVFADQQFYDELQHAAGQVSSLHQVIVHDPQGSEAFGVAEVERRLQGARTQARSPWLLWMTRELADQPLDAVHFVCPGYLSNEVGALALAHSPIDNHDRQWSHFIAAAELNGFLNEMTAWSVAFTIPYESPWSLGLRLLAEQIARERPEPILVHDTHTSDVDGVRDAYHFLYSQDPAAGTHVPKSPWISLYAHPKRLGVLAQQPEAIIESVSQSPFLQTLIEEAPPPFMDLTRKFTPQLGAVTPRRNFDELWKSSLELDVEQAFVRLATDGIETPSERGEAAALHFVHNLLNEGEDW